MNTQVIQAGTNVTSQSTVPTTPRGRALFTIDWFLNGKPVLRNHDDVKQTLTRGRPCY